MESKVTGVNAKCGKWFAGYSIRAGDILLYLLAFQVNFLCFFRQFCYFLEVMMSSGDLVSP